MLASSPCVGPALMPETTLLNSVHPIEIKRETGGPPRTVTPSDRRGDGDLRCQVIVDMPPLRR